MKLIVDADELIREKRPIPEHQWLEALFVPRCPDAKAKISREHNTQ